VIGALTNARKILDVAVTDDEIFVLEGDLSLIRIGHAPNPNSFIGNKGIHDKEYDREVYE